MILTEEKPNLIRQPEFDYAKAFTIFIMVIIHIYEEISQLEECVLHPGLYEGILQFLAGPCGAPIFMTAMGVGMVYSSHRSPGEMMKRGVNIFILGYILNFARDVVPRFIAHGIYMDDDIIYCLLNIDILPFAGLAFMLTGLLKKIKVPVLGLGVIAVLMQIVGQWLAGFVSADSVVSEYLFGLFVYTGEPSCFPLLLWYVYPVLGIILAKYLRHVQDVNGFYLKLFGFGVTVLAGYCAALYFAGYDLFNFFTLADGLFYRQDFLSVIFTVLVVFVELAVIHFLHVKFHSARLERCAKYMGTNLNKIYIVQWLLIGWSYVFIDVTGLPYIPVELIIPVGFIYIGMSLLIVWLFNRFRNKKKAKMA